MAGERPNADIQVALTYHERTKHTAERLRRSPHELDWPNQPIPFKIYQDIASIPLRADPALLTDTTPPAVPDLNVLTRVLYLSAGITKRKHLPGGGELYFRAYPNTGAL